MISFFINSVPLSVTRISGNFKFCYPVFVKCKVTIISVTMRHRIKCYIMRICIKYYNYIRIFFEKGDLEPLLSMKVFD